MKLSASRPAPLAGAVVRLGLALALAAGSATSGGAAPTAHGATAGPSAVRRAVPEMTVAQVVARALEVSPELALLREEPEIFEALAVEESAVLDPLLRVVVGREQVTGRDLSAGGNLFDYRTDDLVGEALLTTLTPFGTAWELEATNDVSDESADGQTLVEARIGARVRQPLLGGAHPSVYLGRARAAEHEAVAAHHASRAAAAALAALVEQLCWDLALAREQIALLQEGGDEARALLASIDARVDSGTMARNELVAAESEIALREQMLLEAGVLLDTSAITLSGYLGRGSAEVSSALHLLDELAPPAEPLAPLEAHVRTALERRPELEQGRAMVRRSEVEVRRTRRGLLPRLDVWAEGAFVGYGDVTARAWDDIDGDHWRFAAGLLVEQPLGDRAGRGDHRRELARRRQALHGLEELERIVETEVRLAHAHARRSLELLQATSRTRRLDEEKLRVEVEAFELGEASSFQVARAQRDLIERRLDELAAIAETRKALVELRRATGTLLDRGGLTEASDQGEDPS